MSLWVGMNVSFKASRRRCAYTRAKGPKEHGMRNQEQAWKVSRACVETLETRILMAADTVLEWNALAVEATRVARLSPNAQTRALAMVHGAVFDAVNGIE